MQYIIRYPSETMILHAIAVDVKPMTRKSCSSAYGVPNAVSNADAVIFGKPACHKTYDTPSRTPADLQL